MDDEQNNQAPENDLPPSGDVLPEEISAEQELNQPLEEAPLEETTEPYSEEGYSEETDYAPAPPPPPTPVEHIFGLLKRFMIPLVLVVVALGIITLIIRIVFSGNGASNKPVTLTYWVLWESEETYAPIIESFKKEHPNITINIVKQTGKEYRERLENAITKGQGPDIFRYHNTWLPMLVQKQIIAPVPEKIMSPKEFESTFYPIVKKDLSVNDVYYGIPLTFDSLALFYNTSMLSSIGANPPTTWRELDALARQLTIPNPSGGIRTAGIALGTTNNIEFWSDIVGMMLLLNGSSITNPQGQNAEEALVYYSLFAQAPNNTWDQSFDNAVVAFAGERLAMMFAPSWIAHEVKALNPNLDFALAKTPEIDGVNVAWATYWVEGVSSQSPNQEAAFTFLKYLSEKENVTKLYAEQAKIRSFGEPYARVDLAQTVSSDPYVSAVLSQATYAQSGYLSSRTYDNGLNDRIIKYYEDAVNAIGQGNSSRSALATVQQGVTQVLTDFGLVTSAPAQ